MKKSMKIFIVLGTVGLLAVGCSKTPEKFADKITSKITRKLDLNDLQQEKLAKIKVAMLAEYKEKKANRGQHKETVKKMILSDKLNKAEIKSMIDEKKQKFEVKFEKYYPLIEDFHASLSAEQKQKLVKLSEKMHKRRKRWH